VTFTADANRRYKQPSSCGNVTGGTSGTPPSCNQRWWRDRQAVRADRHDDTVSTLGVDAAIAVGDGVVRPITRKATGSATAVAFNASATQPVHHG
jgi:hypothetical protein